MKKILLCCSLLLFGSSVMAQQDFLRLHIIAENTNLPIPNAIVNAYCDKKLLQFTTDSTGWVWMANTEKGCMFSIEAFGYDTKYNISAFAKDTLQIILERKNTLLQDVVVTGQAKNVLAEKSIYKINVINSTAIKQLAANNLADALASQINFFKQQDNVLGSSINMQGIGGQNIKILVNGIPLNGRENGNIDASQINIANADRIEIVKGPMSVLYGTDALGGVINIITKQNVKQTTIGLQSYAETNNSMNHNINMGIAKKRHSANINAGRNFFGGFNFTDTFSRAQLWKPKDQYTIDANYTYATSKGKLVYQPNIMWETILNRGTPNVDAFEAYAIDEVYKTKRIVNTILADYELDSMRKITFSNTASYYARTKNRYAKNMVDGTNQLTQGNQDQDTSTFVDYNSRGCYNSRVSGIASLMIGYEVNVQQANSKKLLARNYKNGQQYTVADIASFVSIPVQIKKNITVQPAVRIANNSFYKAPITPSLNIILAMPKQVVVRASYARGFRAPSLKELYLSFVDINHNVTGNDSLLPEISNQVQLHIDAPLVSNNKCKIKLSNSSYYNAIDNQISLAAINVASNAYQYANVDKFVNICNETNVQMHYNNWRNTIGASINNIITADSARGYTNAEILYNTSYSYTKYKLTLNANYRYIGKQAILGISTIGQDANYTAYLPSMQVADANITKQLWHNKVQLQIGVKNIFGYTTLAIQGNSNTSVHGGNGMQNISPGRTYFVNVRYSVW
jgi:outer membrane receptor for ferrienterochelin and colicins